MALEAGIPLISLFDVTNRAGFVLPDQAREFIERFAAVGHRTTVAPGALFHHGRLQVDPTTSGTLSEEIELGFGTLRIPALESGIPFQLALEREPPAGTDPEQLEPAPDGWRLDLALDAFELTVDGLRPALYEPEAGTMPRHLIPDPNRSEVRVTGRAVLRLEKPGPNANVAVRLVDQPDPLDPLSLSGFVSSVSFNPPHFFLGNSAFGLSVGRILYDASESYTPAEIVERGQSAAWTGLSIREATVYAPRGVPVLGDLSGGVRDVLIGNPLGIQGELEIQFGRTALAPATFQIEQEKASGWVDLSLGGSMPSLTAEITGGEEGPVPVRVGLNTSGLPGDPGDGVTRDWTAEWHWPDGSSYRDDASAGEVRHGQTLTVVPLELLEIDGEEKELVYPEISIRFVTAGDPPRIDALVEEHTYTNVVHLRGARSALEEVELMAIDQGGSGGFEWRVVGRPQREQGASYTPDLGDLTGQQTILLTQGADDGSGEVRKTRLMLQIEEAEATLVGCEDFVFEPADDPDDPVDLAAVEATFDLSTFHSEGELEPELNAATLIDRPGPEVEFVVPALARVVIAPDAPPPDPPPDRIVKVGMKYDKPKADSDENPITNWLRKDSRVSGSEDHSPAGSDPGFSQRQLLEWAARYSDDTQFLVVGRCGDLGSSPYNEALAERRAEHVAELLTEWSGGSDVEAVDASRVFVRGEQTKWDSAPEDGPDPDDLEENTEIALSDDEKSEAVDGPDGGWLVYLEQDPSGWPSDIDYPDRERYRRVDVIAVEGTAAEEARRPDDLVLYPMDAPRSLVPAPGRDPTPAAVGTPGMDYRVKLRIVWDSPSATGFADAIPTEAEFEFAWTPQEMPLPPAGGDAVDLSRETLTLVGTWNHDAETGFTKLTLGLESAGDPDGLFKLESEHLTLALALGPALLSGVDADTELVESGARVGALLAASALAGGLLDTDSKTAVKRLAAETEAPSLSDPGTDARYRALLDYLCELHVETGVFDLATDPDGPMKLRYKDVGVEYDTSASGWDRVGMVYDSTSMEIEDPGSWSMGSSIGDLIRIVEVTMGRGSLWLEATAAFALELGLIEITEATIRLAWDDGGSSVPDFQLRGFEARVEVPDTIEGEGRLRIEDGGVIRAGVECDVIPAGLGADAALSLARKTSPEPYVFLGLHVGVQFATPLPLAQSGLAIYGLRGMFTMNGERALPANPDPVARELEWFGEDPENKYAPKLGQYALGLGAVVGTMPDASFCMSCEGMIAVGFPDPEVIFGVKINIIEVPDTEVSDQAQDPESAAITGVIVIDDEAVKLGAAASYQIPEVLDLDVPFSGYFPYPGSPGDVYVRIGSDGVEGRHGEPVTATVLPGTLDARSWSYLMIEQAGLPSLGGDDRFSFDGFSVGFGAGWEISWSAGKIRLMASAKVLVGFGTDPLVIKGGIFVSGELSLVVVSISARGELILEIREPMPGETDVYVRVDGEFCGEVDLFFFSLSGCVGVSIGSDKSFSPPEPRSPVKGVSLTDRHDRIMGTATTGTPQAEPLFPPVQDDGSGVPTPEEREENHTVWPDTAPVIHFSHYVENALPSGGQFSPGPTPSQPRWAGSSELKYAYRLDRVILREEDGSLVSGDLQSVWATNPFRQPTSNGGTPPSEHEGPNLKLLDWNPWAWTLNTDDGGASQEGDPEDTVGDLCDPPPKPARLCLFGREARTAGLHCMRIYPPAEVPGPYPSRFRVTGCAFLIADGERVTGEALRLALGEGGGTVVAGGVHPLPFTHQHGDVALDSGYRLPRARTVHTTGLTDLPLPFHVGYSTEVTRPSVTLLVCDAPAQERPGSDPDEHRHCEDLGGLEPDNELRIVVERGGFRFRSLDEDRPLHLIDKVDQDRTPPVEGEDGSAEILFPESGMSIELPEACEKVEVHVALFAGPVRAVARDASGSNVDSDSVSVDRDSLAVLTLSGGGITEVRVAAGENEAAVFKVCCVGPGAGPDDEAPDSALDRAHDDAARIQDGLPTVTGHPSDPGDDVPWPSKVVRTERGESGPCRVVEYRPGPEDAAGPWDGFTVASPAGKIVWLLSACGVEQASVDAREDDAQVKDTLIGVVSDATTADPSDARPVLLKKDMEYEMEIRWSWQAWQADDAGDTPPGTPPSGAWQQGTTDVLRFRTAADAPTGAETQDGLNEYVFDARDLGRYLLGTEPDDARTPHFTDDPVWAHFAAGHISELAQAYGRELELEIRRTDPPPQPQADLTSGTAPVATTVQWTPLAAQHLDASYEALNEAIADVPCVPDGSGPLGGASMAVDADLEPDAGYDLIITGSRTDGSDRVEIATTHFRTSRYSGPSELLGALGYQQGAGREPTAPDDYVIPAGAHLPSGGGGLEVGDSALDAALAGIELDTLPPPSAAQRNLLLWSLAGASWQLEGLLVDSLEPLDRTRSVVGADGTPEAATRLALARARITGAGTHEMTPLRANTAWTRVLLAPAAPVSLPQDQDPTLSLELQVPGGTVSGSRRLPTVPSILAREGL